MGTILRSTTTAVLIAAAVQCLTLGFAQKLPRGVCSPDIEETRTHVIQARPLVRLLNTDGAIHVSAGDVHDIKVEARIRAYLNTSGEEPAVREYVAGLVAVEEAPDELLIVTEPGERPDNLELEVIYTLTVPKATDLDIEVSNGNVYVAKGCGRVDVRGNNAGIQISEPEGAVHARSIIGRVEVYGAPAATTLETTNGNVYAEMLKGALRASTTNGNIEAQVLDPEVNWCDLTTKNGRITLGLAETCSAFVNAKTSRGTVTSDLEVSPLSGTQKRRELFGVIGAGQTKVNMSALNGSIEITRSETL
ncbi:MAG: DUF4097 family beta strand repeat protein [Candidatus Hydrogenedentes bacterium]|nr:DUF4097 family beta strand repeat protein [Candidatus Hydrogenedentota bacterium]